jgi:hypothetical protein
MRVLFIGNSYIASHNLPAIVAQMAKHKGKVLHHEAHLPGSRTFRKHWEEGKAVKLIRKGGWDAVVLQGQSFEPVGDPANTLKYAERLCKEIDKVKARKVFFCTWAYGPRPRMLRTIENPEHRAQIEKLLPEMQQRLNATYSDAAKRCGGEVAPVGPAWELSLKLKPRRRLHGRDQSHPAPVGSYLAGLVLYAVLFEDSPTNMPRSIRTGRSMLTLPRHELRALEAAAQHAVDVWRPSED